MKAFLTFVCCFFTVAFSLPAQTLLEGYVRDMECADGKPRMVRSGNKVLIDKLGNSPHAQGSDMYTFMIYPCTECTYVQWRGHIKGDW